MPRTMFDKIWETHVVTQPAGEPALIYIDLHLVHEVTSPQAFEGLRLAGRAVRRPELTVATIDHNVPTTTPRLPIEDRIAARQIEALRRNCDQAGIRLHDIGSGKQGIVHVIGPELGLTRPGMTIVCGDSHTSTHGAFGALAFGIGTSEVEHVLATQCLPQNRPQTMEIRVQGALPAEVTAKDLALAIIGRIGTAGATGHVIEYTGEAVRALSMEGRMTLCNMSIEAGAHAGMVAPDATTIEYVESRPGVSIDPGDRERIRGDWLALATDARAEFDCTVEINAGQLAPHVTWGTQPAMVAPVTGCVPEPTDMDEPATAEASRRALEYMELVPGTPIEEIKVDRVFIGSCTNGRIEDLRAAARVLSGHRIHAGVQALIVPGSEMVQCAAEIEGLHTIFQEAGCEWREPGCSMCLGMNPDVLGAGERCASTSNRNFEGRQGRGGRTHLVSPAMAAAAAVAGHFVDVRAWRFHEAMAAEPCG